MKFLGVLLLGVAAWLFMQGTSTVSASMSTASAGGSNPPDDPAGDSNQPTSSGPPPRTEGRLPTYRIDQVSR